MRHGLVVVVRAVLLAVAVVAAIIPTASYGVVGSSYARAYVQKAYVAYYGRAADPAGQDYWAYRMDSEGGSLNAIIVAYGYSDEFNRRYGGLSYATLVTKIYQQALGRNPDPAGLNYYVTELNAGRKTLQTITLDVLNGATTAPDSIVVSNKLQVAAYFTSRVAGGCPYGTEQDGVNLLAAVSADFSTALAARSVIDGRCGANSGNTAQGIWYGRTSTNAAFWGITLDNGDAYYYYQVPGYLPSGFVQGTFGGANAVDFNTDYGYVAPIAISISYLPRSYMQGTATEFGDLIPFAGLYNPEYERPASLAAVAGTYVAEAATPASGWGAVPLTVFPNGTLSGAGNGCTFSGTVVPHGTVNIYDLAVQFHGGACIFGFSTLYGIAYYDPFLNGIVAMAPNASRTNGLMLFGLKY